MALPFAAAADIATRLGRDLTTEEQSMVELVLEGVSGLILAAVGKDEDWGEELDPIPAAFRFVCIEKTLQIGSNPNQLRSISEQLGQYQNTKAFRGGPDSDLYLTREERRMVRKAVGASTMIPVTLESPYSGDDEVSEIFDNDIPL